MIGGKEKSSGGKFRAVFLCGTALFVLAMAVWIALSAGRLVIWLRDRDRPAEILPESSAVTVAPDPEDEGRLIVTARTPDPKVFIQVSRADGSTGFEYVRVYRGGFIYNVVNGNFSGCRGASLILLLYIWFLTALAAVSFRRRCRNDLYSYTTLYIGGSMLFLAGISLTLTLDVLHLFLNPAYFTMINVYSSFRGAGASFMFYSIPAALIASVALAVSNLTLIRRERKRIVNLLALALSVLIIGGYAGYFFLDNLFSMGSEMEMRIWRTITGVYSTAFAYFETMFLSAVLCGLIAAKKKPSPDRTHVIILGCAIGKDGQPLPLLRGRIDRAVEYAREQREGDGGIRFVPSGGKGPDEVVSESEAMKGYLLSQGIPQERILMEDRSANTRENMRFSRDLIEADCPDGEAKILFSTSGYHVLRSGMISREEGLSAEGIGSRTKWYFWPNAFVREFIGLLAGKWKEHLFWMAVFVAASALISMTIPI